MFGCLEGLSLQCNTASNLVLLHQVTAQDADDSDQLTYSLVVGRPDIGFFANSSTSAVSTYFPDSARHHGLNDTVNNNGNSTRRNDIPIDATQTEYFSIDPKTGDIRFTKVNNTFFGVTR